MWFGIVSLFPDMFNALNAGITGRAIADKRFTLEYANPRNFAKDKHQTVDDHPYGGGPGMVMRVEPLQLAIQSLKNTAPSKPTTILLSPQGKPFDQAAAANMAQSPSIIFVCGRYEGVDERLIELEIDEEWSIGDYILTGGELGAMVMIDAITRHLPGVVGDYDSVEQDSLSSGLLKYPQYTRPEIYAGKPVPDILLSGHHKHIADWRLNESLCKTYTRRPDLLSKIKANMADQKIISNFLNRTSKK